VDDEDGRLCVRCAQGWIDAQAADGTELLHPVEMQPPPTETAQPPRHSHGDTQGYLDGTEFESTAPGVETAASPSGGTSGPTPRRFGSWRPVWKVLRAAAVREGFGRDSRKLGGERVCPRPEHAQACAMIRDSRSTPRATGRLPPHVTVGGK
jgi:hypothetical protein